MRTFSHLILSATISFAFLTGCSKAPEHNDHQTPHEHHASHETTNILPESLVAVSFTDPQLGVDVTIAQPIIRAAFSQATTGAAYVTLSNHGQQEVTLQSATAPVSLVDEVQLHDMVMDGETMKMEQIMDGIALAVGTDITLQPGGKHIMLMGLNDTLDAGKTFPLTLNFGESGSITVDFTVVKL